MLLNTDLRRGLILGTAFALAGKIAIRPASALDPDIWWRIRTGEWILQNRALPRAETFSWPVAGRPYTEYSWILDVVAQWLYRHGGLAFISLFVLVFALLIAAVLYVALVRRSGNALAATAATAFSMLAMGKIMTPRPWLFSILLFTIEVWILCRVRRTRSWRELWLLVPVLFLWANLHVQFVYGLFALFLFAADAAVMLAINHAKFKQVVPLVGAAGAAVLATLLTPFGWRLYETVFDYAGQSASFTYINELQAPKFRTLDDYLLIVLVAVVGVVVGRATKAIEPFLIALCLVGSVLAFRSARDAWVLAIPAAFVLCNPTSFAPLSFSKKSVFVGIVACGCILVPMSLRRLNAGTLQPVLARQFPVAACDFIARSHIAGRIYTPFDWGGYVIWRLPESTVSMDGRTNVQGNNRLARYTQTANASVGWQDDPDLQGAEVVLVMKRMPLASVLRQTDGYRLVYDDDVATVFVHSQLKSASASNMPGS